MDRTRTRHFFGISWVVFFTLGVVAPGLSRGGVRLLDDEEEKKEEKEQSEKEDEESDAYFAVVGGDVITGTGAVLRGATVLSKNGVIEAIGNNVFLPEGTETLDASGMRVYPGLIALNASSRISGGLLAAEAPIVAGRDILDHLNESIGRALGRESHVDTPDNRRGDEIGDWEDLQGEEGAGAKGSKHNDSFDPFSPYMTMALAAGITTADQSGAAVKLKRGEIGDVVMNERNLVSFSWSTGNPSGIRSLREKFRTTQDYLGKYRAWEKRGDKDEKEPPKKSVDRNALRVLQNRAFARFRANDREDLLGIARFAQEFGFRPVIDGCREGWTVADELGRAGAYAIIIARDRRPKDESLVRSGGSKIENAAILHRHGVQIAVKAFTTSIESMGITGRDVLHLPVEAAFAVRGGLSNEAALAAITTVPARILGISRRVGTLVEGKDCDLIVTDGDILHYQTFVQYAVVSGKLVYDKEKELYFAHIRPRPEGIEEGIEVEAVEVDGGEESSESGDGEEDGEEDGDEDGDEDGGEDEGHQEDDDKDS